MLGKENIIGMKFGRLTVLKEILPIEKILSTKDLRKEK